MRQKVLGLIVAGLSGLLAWPQEIKMPVNLDRLAQRASDTVDVTLDASMLQLASRFLSKDDPDEAQVKKIVSKLKGIYVRSFEFNKDGQYSMSDVDAIRAQLKAPGWSRIVGVKSAHGENSEIYVKKDRDQVAGLVVLDTEPKELTIVQIDGPIDPEELSELGGHMGIPKLGKLKHGEKDKTGNSKDKDNDEE